MTDSNPKTQFPSPSAHWWPRFGAFPQAEGTRFVLRSPNFHPALVLFHDETEDTPSQIIPFAERFGDVWQLFVPAVGEGQAYAIANAEDPDAPWFVDPYARAIGGRRIWGDAGARDKGIITDGDFDWSGDLAPDTPLLDSLVYEVHLHGATARERRDHNDPRSPFAAFMDKIEHIASLGVTAVEFLPIHHFEELEYGEEDERHGLRNYWGYSTQQFFAPMARYGTPFEFKTLVRALHEAGIEVWLDVVYNHTGKRVGLHHLYEATYYILQKNGDHTNYTGCGNTVNTNHPVVAEMILDSLRYWASEYHIDGFRFDLASIFCRDEKGALVKEPPLVRNIDADPVLSGVKLIAEAWDAAGAYHVGNFPGKRWSDWNGKFRDDVRDFWCRGSASPSALASRLTGSDDMYARHPLGPAATINFVTCHDGFTLRDLVSYNLKHNKANREENRDGESHNRSQNFGVEGPSDDPAINARRLRMQKNFLASLMMSQGVPMICAGDEFGRTQQGNNNAYCQDNEIGWIDWSLAGPNTELTDFLRQLSEIRREYEVLRAPEFAGAAGRGKDKERIQWFGATGKAVNWNKDRALAMCLYDPDDEKDLLVLINNERRPRRFPIALDAELLLTSDDRVEVVDGKTKAWRLPAETVAILAPKS